VFHLARYDPSYDVRDRGRLLTSLLDNLSPSLFTTSETGDGQSPDSASGTVSLRLEQIKMALFQGKDRVNETRRDIDPHRTLGSLEAVISKQMGVSRSLSGWLSTVTDPSLRDTEEDRIAATGLAAAPPSVKGNPELQSSLGSTQRNSATRRDDLDAFYAEEDSEGEDETDVSEETESEGEQEK